MVQIGWTQGFHYFDLSGLTPSYNTPVVTFASMAAAASPTIAGSPGWLREKRIDIAETAAGGTQSSSADLDLNGSTRFRYPGTINAEPTASNPTRYVSSYVKPGGSAQAAYWLLSIDTILTGDTIEFAYNTTAVAAQLGLIVVDGLRVQETAFLTPTPSPAAGAGAAVKLVFPDSRTRRVKIYGMNSSIGRWGGAAVPAGQSIAKPSSVGRTIAIVGDTFVSGSSGIRQVETFIWQAAFRLGAESIVHAGIGVTGIIRTLSGEPTSNFAGRTPGVLSQNPDVVIIAGGYFDDIYTASAVQAALEALLDSYASVSERYVVPTINDSHSIRAGLIAACASRSVPFVDLSIDSYAKIDSVSPTLSEHKRLGNDIVDWIESQ
jgi:hypothetical protein